MAESSQTWIRRDESELAAYLRDVNLEHANEIQHDVNPRRNLYSKYVKRVIDIIISALALAVSLPINIVLAIITMKDVGSPIFYKQERTGKNGKPFVLTKFRNMTNDTDSNGELLPPSQRVTPSGKVIRKYSLDELLNFWSIFKGDMSIIGPRPLPVQYTDRLSNRHYQRHKVKPGLLCPITEEFKQKYPFPIPYSRYQAQFETEIWYVENISFCNDVKLLILLVKETFDMDRRGKNADSASPFVGYDEKGFAVSRQSYEKCHLSEEGK